MEQDRDEVVQHYGSDEIVARIDEALAKRGADLARLSPEMLYPFDQLHGRQLAATRDHVARLAPTPAMHVLDVGSGVGGPARYIAATTGARVTGLDLTPQFVTAASELTARCGLADCVNFVLGNAADMPFADDNFDAALCLYVGMNIEDKPAVASEIYRVLKPGGFLLWSQAVAGQGFPRYPLPWATRPEASFAGPEDGLLQALLGAGFTIVENEDETVLYPLPGGSPSPEGDASVNQLVMGDDFSERRRNFVSSLAEGSLRSIAIKAQK